MPYTCDVHAFVALENQVEIEVPSGMDDVSYIVPQLLNTKSDKPVIKF